MDPNELLYQKILHHCPECCRTFQYKSKLDRHFLVHSKIKKYFCQFCQAGFSLSYNLDVHMRIHKGLRPYKCHHPNCGKSFTQSNNLTVHLKLHRGFYNKILKSLGREWTRDPETKVEHDRNTNCSEGYFNTFDEIW